jgi:hypothetical protein
MFLLALVFTAIRAEPIPEVVKIESSSRTGPEEVYDLIPLLSHTQSEPATISTHPQLPEPLVLHSGIHLQKRSLWDRLMNKVDPNRVARKTWQNDYLPALTGTVEEIRNRKNEIASLAKEEEGFTVQWNEMIETGRDPRYLQPEFERIDMEKALKWEEIKYFNEIYRQQEERAKEFREANVPKDSELWHNIQRDFNQLEERRYLKG